MSVAETTTRPAPSRGSRGKRRVKQETSSRQHTSPSLTAEQFFAYYALFASIVFTMMFIFIALMLGGT